MIGRSEEKTLRSINPACDTHIITRASGKFPFSLEGIVTKLPNGEIFASWTSGGRSEPRIGNIVRSSRSSDGGKTWHKPITLLSHPSKGVFASATAIADQQLLVFFNSYRDDTNFAEDMQSYICKSSDCGSTFSTPQSIKGCINNVHIKQSVWANGKVYLPFSWREIDGVQWAAPTLGRAPKNCVVGNRRSSHTEIPLSVGDDITYAHYHKWAAENTREYVGVIVSKDCGESYEILGRVPGLANIRSFCEPTLCQLSDGTFVMYIRSNDINRIFESRSFDDGKTWTEPHETDIPTPITKVRLLRDLRGRIILLHNPSYTRRNPLSMWVSTDDLKSWSIKIDLITDDMFPCSYPDGYIDEETNELCFSWEDRRNVYFTRLNTDLL